MTVGGQVFSGKGAREEAAMATARAVFLRRDDYRLRKRPSFRSFEIFGREQPGATAPCSPLWLTVSRASPPLSQGKRWWVRLREKGGKHHELPVHQKAEEYLDAYIESAGMAEQKGTPA